MEFRFEIAAVSKLRVRVTWKSTYTPGKTRVFSNTLKNLFRRDYSAFKPLAGPVEVNVIFMIKKPKSAPKKRIFPTVKPDLDNLGKAVLDAMNGLMWLDDNQIVSLSFKEYYADDGVDMIYVQAIDLDEKKSSRL